MATPPSLAPSSAAASAPIAGCLPDLVYDVGMHCGQDTRHYLDEGFRVVAIEADPGLVAAAQERFAAEISRGRLVVLHGAICRTEGQVPIWLFPDKNEWNTLDAAHARRNQALGYRVCVVEVPAFTLDQVFAERGVPHYLKIDIEGADLLCVRTLAGLTALPDYVSLEVTMTGTDGGFEALAQLYTLGYRRFKLVDQALNPTLHCTGGKKFEMGSSGAFGDATPGAWLDSFAIARQLAAMVRAEQRTVTASARMAWVRNGLRRLPVLARDAQQWRASLTTNSWYDLHAALPAAAAAAVKA